MWPWRSECCRACASSVANSDLSFKFVHTIAATSSRPPVTLSVCRLSICTLGSMLLSRMRTSSTIPSAKNCERWPRDQRSAFSRPSLGRNSVAFLCQQGFLPKSLSCWFDLIRFALPLCTLCFCTAQERPGGQQPHPPVPVVQQGRKHHATCLLT